MKKLIPRKFERKRFVGEAAVRPLTGGVSMSAQVLNLAQSGLAMFVSHGLPTGQLVELTFRVTEPATRAGLDKREGRVVRSQANPDGNVIGIVFTQRLETNEMQLLEENWVRT